MYHEAKRRANGREITQDPCDLLGSLPLPLRQWESLETGDWSLEKACTRGKMFNFFVYHRADQQTWPIPPARLATEGRRMTQRKRPGLP
jgi:hypothetical protein